MQLVTNNIPVEAPGRKWLRTDVPQRLLGLKCTSVGKLASMSEQELIELIESQGGYYVRPWGKLISVRVLIIGEGEWPLTRSGHLQPYLRTARVCKEREGQDITILSERLFLEALNCSERAEATHRLYTVATLIELLGVTRNQIRAWVRAGLIEPVCVERGVWYFDFLQVSAAKTICEVLTRHGVTVASLRRQLLRLRQWMPEADAPLSQLAAIEANGTLLMRLAKGELATDDGQLHIDFEHPAEEAPPSLKLVPEAPAPQSAEECHEVGIQHEQDGFLADAEAAYREALMFDGPNPQLVFDLAHVLQQLGRVDEAIERYRQVVEMDSDHVDAWNNLGVLLAERGRANEACEAFQRALNTDPSNAMARYNLADTLDELKRPREACVHWKEYLRYDPVSPRGTFARQRLRATGG